RYAPLPTLRRLAVGAENNDLLALHGRQAFQEIVNGLTGFEIVKQVCTGTRVPANTGVPPMISGLHDTTDCFIHIIYYLWTGAATT
ncbi:MAG: hypothetical protein WCE79_21520, partial [Xanthobacteraceae bacterium]